MVRVVREVRAVIVVRAVREVSAVIVVREVRAVIVVRAVLTAITALTSITAHTMHLYLPYCSYHYYCPYAIPHYSYYIIHNMSHYYIKVSPDTLYLCHLPLVSIKPGTQHSEHIHTEFKDVTVKELPQAHLHTATVSF